MLEAGDLRMDLDSTATRAGEPLDLTVKEFELLRVLVENAGQGRQARRARARGLGSGLVRLDEDARRPHQRLRKKLGDDPAAPRYIHTVRGVGFRFDAP